MLLIIFVICLVFLIRTVLIITGMLKSPVLQTFEKYGDSENIYHPLPSLLFWTGMLLAVASPVVLSALRSTFPALLPGFVCIFAAYLIYTNPNFIRQYPNIFFVYPRWYHELRARTTRYERRRIAYKWLWLPARLRAIYNVSDRAFNQWADLVIMSTTDLDETPGSSSAWAIYDY